MTAFFIQTLEMIKNTCYNVDTGKGDANTQARVIYLKMTLSVRASAIISTSSFALILTNIFPSFR